MTTTLFCIQEIMDFSNPTQDEKIMFALIIDVEPHKRKNVLMSYLLLIDIGYAEGSGQDEVVTEHADIERRATKATAMLEYLYG